MLALPGLATLHSAAAKASSLGTISLVAGDNWTTIAGRPAYLSTFNGRVPGPIFEGRPGETFRIAVGNMLAEETNLHFHGLHVPPTGAADNSFLEIPPDESLVYEITIPDNHPEGLFWYHPHMHGSVARQVSRGLAGLFYIRGEFDDQPEVRSTPEFPIVLQDFNLDVAGHVIEPSASELTRGREGPLVTVNGAANPTFPIQSGGWVRLRVLNASASRFYRLKLEQHPLTIVGVDGGLIAAPVEVDELLIVPGQRYDLFVRGRAQQGRFNLLNLPYDRFGGMGAGMGGPNTSQSALPAALAAFEYTGVADSSWPLPQRLASFPTPESPAISRTFTFGMGMGMGGGIGMGMGSAAGGSFTINGRRFDPARVDTLVALDSTEEWEIVNPTTMDHPFHLHTNAFQVVDSTGALEQAWRDVVLVPAGRRLRIRIPFRDFPGRAMYHCHILDHEDLGMMGIVEFAQT